MADGARKQAFGNRGLATQVMIGIVAGVLLGYSIPTRARR